MRIQLWANPKFKTPRRSSYVFVTQKNGEVKRMFCLTLGQDVEWFESHQDAKIAGWEKIR